MTNKREWTWRAEVCARWAVAMTLALGFGATGWLAVQEPTQDLVGAHRASDPSAARASYLIQGTSIYSPQALAKAQGWVVTHRLELINAIAVDAPVEQVEAIAPRWPGITRVTN